MQRQWDFGCIVHIEILERSSIAESAARLAVDAGGLEKAWRLLEKDNLTVKFGGGFYCGRLKDGSGTDFYSINAFYLNMRAVYTTPPAAVYFYSVTWPAASLSWADFRNKVGLLAHESVQTVCCCRCLERPIRQRRVLGPSGEASWMVGRVWV